MKEIKFIYKSTHQMRIYDGAVTMYPALPATSKLYVIQNEDTNRHIYVGTAEDVQSRFSDRLKSTRDLGFGEGSISNVTVSVVAIKINDQSKTPGKTGMIDNLNVEKLLLWTYIKKFNQSSRNSSLTGTNFKNETGEKIQWKLTNETGSYVPYITENTNYELDNNEVLN